MTTMENTMKRLSIIALTSVGALTSVVFTTGVAWGQGGRGGGGGWTTSRADAQRTGWVRADAAISVDGVQTSDFGLQWTTKVGHTARETISEGVSNNTAQLDPQPGNVAGSANNLYGYEIDTGAVTWTKHFDVPAGPAPTAACPGGMAGGVTRETSLTPNVVGTILGGRGGGAAGRGAVGGVGAPGEGVPTALVVRAGRGGAAGFSGGGAGLAGGGGGARAGRGASGGGANFAGGGGAQAASGPARAGLRGAPAEAYVVASDGMLHAVGEAQGKELKKPVPFLPANANATELVAVGTMMYTSTINNCGGVPNGVWAIDLSDGTVKSWKSGVTPVGAIALSSNGTLYVATGSGTDTHHDAIVALDPKTLTEKDWLSTPGPAFSTGPVIFSQGGRELVAAATKDGTVFLLDAASLGGADHKKPLATSAATTSSKTWSPSALATFEDSSQTRWLLLPAVGMSSGITAFKVSGTSLQKAWTSSVSLMVPSAPVVVNGVVFAVNSGSAASPAVLYALDGATGKEVWNSGKAIKSFVKSAGLWAMSGQVYVATNDAMIYAFGTSMGR